MSSLLDFFTLEAGEYLERLDGLLARTAGGPPALDAFLADVRALRGSATMAKQGAIAEVASGLERVARALGDRTVAWDAATHAAFVAAVDDLKILVRSVRTWGPADDQRAIARRDELSRLAPVRARTSSPVTAAVGSSIYLSSEAGDIAAAIDVFTLTPSESAALMGALPRIRAMRGMAALKDLPPMGDVFEAIEDAVRPIEFGTGTLGPDVIDLLRAASAFLRRASLDLRSGTAPNPSSDEARAFAATIDALGGTARVSDQVVPIASLFFSDAGPHVVNTASSPPTTPAQRFRMEVVSQAEHLHRLVSDAREARDEAGRARAGRALLGALGALRATALSFVNDDVANFVQSIVAGAGKLDTLALGAIGEAATLLANPSTGAAQLSERLRALSAGRSVDAAIAAGLSPVSRGTPVSVQRTEPRLTETLEKAPATPVAPPLPAAPAPSPAPPPAPPPRPSRPTPSAIAMSGAGATSGADLHALLASGIAGLNRLDKEPFSQPADIEEDLQPIDQFLYRGRAALDRAIELRNEIRGRGGPPESSEIDELFALLDLATVE